MTRRIGIYPGTFDPIHQGHIAFAQEAMRVCGLNEVIFLPERRPRGKEDAVTDIHHRIALIERATETIADLRVLRLTSKRFTVDETLPELRAAFPEATLTMLIGSDIVQTFPYRWEGLSTLLGEVSLAIGMRAGDTPEEVTAIIGEVERGSARPVAYTCISTPEVATSSSSIRNGSLDMSRLHPAVLDYITANRLYESSPQS